MVAGQTCLRNEGLYFRPPPLLGENFLEAHCLVKKGGVGLAQQDGSGLQLVVAEAAA